MSISGLTRFSLWVGARYVRSRHRGISRLINWVSFLGLVFGITLLTVVLSVHNGLMNRIQDSFFKLIPHATLESEVANEPLLERLKESNKVVKIDQFFQLEGLVRNGRYITSTKIYGLDSLPTTVQRSLPSGNSLDPEFIGASVMTRWASDSLRLRRGDTFSLSLPISGPSGLSVRTGKFLFVGNIDLPGELGQILTVVNLEGMLDQGLIHASQIDWRITVDDPLRVDRDLAEFDEIRTWTSDFGAYFRAVVTEKAILFVMLIFVIALASFNVVSSQAMLINSKRGDIAILRTMGASDQLVKLVFAIHGLVIAILGIAVGLIVGVVVSHYVMPFIAFMTELVQSSGAASVFRGQHADVRIIELTLTAVISLLLACVAVIKPLSLVLRTNPVEALQG